MRRRAWACALLFLCACAKNAENPAEPPSAQGVLAPALRRLSVGELELSASAVLGAPLALSQVLPPDALQTDFSRNIGQSVDSLTLRQLYDATRLASEDVPLTRPPVPSCAALAARDDSACAHEVVATLAALAFRRDPSEDELTRLLALFAAGTDGGTFRDGVTLVQRALLASPQFLYEASLGEGQAMGGVQRLTQAELASALSFFITGAPPDSELMQAAAAGQLSDGAARQAQAVRLLGHVETLPLFQRFVEQWLGLVQLPALAKSSAVTGDFGVLSRAMRGETRAFVADVFRSQGGALQTLFAGGYSLVPDELAPVYGILPVGADTRVSLRSVSRVGLLQQGSFLAVFAHEAESAPVLRGKAVLVRLLCRTIRPPQELGIDVVPPAADPHATTRQRFARHVSDPLCASCHAQLDPVGFTFENFDAIGRKRESEQGQPVDTRGSISIDGTVRTLTDSVALSDAIAQSQELRTCAARQVVRFASGRQDPDAEAAFVAEVASLPLSWNGSLLGLFLSYVKSESFAWRKAP